MPAPELGTCRPCKAAAYALVTTRRVVPRWPLTHLTRPYNNKEEYFLESDKRRWRRRDNVVTSSRFPSSRQQFEQYKREFHESNGSGPKGPAGPRERSALTLVRSFLGLLHGHYLSLSLSLATLTLATLLALIPPAATKFVVD